MWIGLAAASLLIGGATVSVVAADDPTGTGAGRLFRDGPLANLIRGQVGRWMVLRSELHLSPEQKQQLRATLSSHKKEIAQTVDSVVVKRQALRDAVLAEKDEETIRAAAGDLGKVLGDAAVKASKLHHELKTKVQWTEEQAARLKAFRAESDAALMRFLTEAEK
jgi:hypothetical protein